MSTPKTFTYRPLGGGLIKLTAYYSEAMQREIYQVLYEGIPRVHNTWCYSYDIVSVKRNGKIVSRDLVLNRGATGAEDGTHGVFHWALPVKA